MAIYYNNITKEYFRKCWASQALGPSLRDISLTLEAPGLHDDTITIFNTLSIQTHRGHIKKAKSGKSKWWLRFYSSIIAHEKGFKYHAQPQTGAYSWILL